MIEHKISLAVAFLQSHPESAARILEQKPIKEVAAFLEKIPLSDAAHLLCKMLPKCAAAICAEVPYDRGIGMLSHLSSEDIVSILRCLSPGNRERFINELPVRKQVSCKLMLGYAEDMVGAYVTTDVVIVPYDANAGEALEIVKSTNDAAPSEFVFVVHRDGTLKGRFQSIDLLRCSDELPVSSLVDEAVEVVRGRMNIREVFAHKAWQRQEVMAVLNRRKAFIGVLRYANLRSAIEALDNQTTFIEKPELITGIVQGYGQSLLALLQSIKEFVVSDLNILKGSSR